MSNYTNKAKISLDEWGQMGGTFYYRKGANEHPVFYLDTGESQKPVLLLIHGFPTCSWDWNMLWEGLSNYFRLITCDLLGFGLSAKPRGYPYSIMDQADMINQLCNSLNVSDAHLLAHDYGDTVAQELLARSNEGVGNKILSCAFLNGGLFPEVHRPAFIQKLLISPIGGLVAKLSSYRAFKRNFDRICSVNIREDDLQQYWELLIRDGGKAAIPKLISYMTERTTYRERWVGTMRSSQAPMVLIDGIEDPISGLHMADRYRLLISENDVVELAGIGHYPQLEAPGRVFEALLDYFSTNKIIERVK